MDVGVVHETAGPNAKDKGPSKSHDSDERVRRWVRKPISFEGSHLVWSTRKRIREKALGHSAIVDETHNENTNSIGIDLFIIV